MPNQLEFTFIRLGNQEAVNNALGLNTAVGIVNSISKQKGSSTYTVTCDGPLVNVVDGALRALVHIGAIDGLRGPFPVTPVGHPHNIGEPIYFDALGTAAFHLRKKENVAAREEGLGEICSDMQALVPYHNGMQWELRVLFDYGLEGDRVGKTARIWVIDDTYYRLEWT